MKTFKEYIEWLEGFKDIVEPPRWWESVGLGEPIDEERGTLLHNLTMIDNSNFEVNASPLEVSKILMKYGLVHQETRTLEGRVNKPSVTDSYTLPNDSNFHFWHNYNPYGTHWGEGFFVLQDLPNQHLYKLGKHATIIRHNLNEAKFIINNNLQCNHSSRDKTQILDGRRLLIYLLQRIQDERMPSAFYLNSGIFVYNDPNE